MLAALSVAPLVPASGEEVLPTIPGRLDGGLDSRIVPRTGSPFDPQAGEVRTQELEIGVNISAAYDDNIYLSASRKEADLVMRVAPAIHYRRGDKVSGEGGYLRVAYRPAAVAYADNSGNNRLDQVAEWDIGWRGKKTAIFWKGAARRLGDATADTGTLTDRSEFSNEVRLAWSIREKVSLELAGGHESLSYDSSAYADSSLTFGELALKYAYSPKTRLGLMYKAGRFEVDGAGEQTLQRLTGRIEWTPREKIAVDLEVGGEHRSFDKGSETIRPVQLPPIFPARTTPRPARRSESRNGSAEAGPVGSRAVWKMPNTRSSPETPPAAAWTASTSSAPRLSIA
jgi:hypothetical protein